LSWPDDVSTAQLQEDLLTYWLLRGDEFGLAMLALAMRLTLSGNASWDEKREICILFVNAAQVLLKDPDFSVDAEALMQIAFKRIDATPNGRPLADELRSVWSFFSGTQVSSAFCRDLRDAPRIEWIKEHFYPRLENRSPYHRVLLQRQQRVRERLRRRSGLR